MSGANFDPIKKWRDWSYKNTFFLIVGLILLFYFADSPTIQSTIKQIGKLGYFGAFLAGILIVSTYTVAPAVLILFDIAKNIGIIQVSILSGLGAALGDYLVFRLLKDRVFDELKPIFDKIGGPVIKMLYESPYFAWFLPFLGAVLIASPIPDEIGLTILGLSKIKNWQFLILTFILNAVGIFLLILVMKTLTVYIK